MSKNPKLPWTFIVRLQSEFTYFPVSGRNYWSSYREGVCAVKPAFCYLRNTLAVPSKMYFTPWKLVLWQNSDTFGFEVIFIKFQPHWGQFLTKFILICVTLDLSTPLGAIFDKLILICVTLDLSDNLTEMRIVKNSIGSIVTFMILPSKHSCSSIKNVLHSMETGRLRELGHFRLWGHCLLITLAVNAGVLC